VKLDRYISPEYLQMQKELHKLPKGYGGGGHNWMRPIRELIRKQNFKSVLDYGCGRGTLVTALRNKLPGVNYFEYDPAIKGKDVEPPPCELVVCTDVMEHIEPDRLGLVIDHLFRLSQRCLFVVVATRPSGKWLSDSRNAHLIIEPDSWWKERFKHPHFEFADPLRSTLDKPAREWVALLVKKK
jgi:hypothetical protein